MAKAIARASPYTSLTLSPDERVKPLQDEWWDAPRQLHLDGLETALLPPFISGFPIHVTRVANSRNRFAYFAGFAAIDAIDLLDPSDRADVKLLLLIWSDITADEMTAMARSDLAALHFHQFDRRSSGEHLRLYLARRWGLSSRQIARSTRLSRHQIQRRPVHDNLDLRDVLFGDADEDE